MQQSASRFTLRNLLEASYIVYSNSTRSGVIGVMNREGRGNTELRLVMQGGSLAVSAG